MPVEEVQEENRTQLDEDTVDQKPISNSQNSNQSTTEDDKHNEEVPTGSVEVPEETGVRVCEDIRYDKFFKMKQFGVPVEAVKLKMSAEGLDPTLLE